MKNAARELTELYILQIVKEHTDAEHPMLYEEIGSRLREEYGLEYERKTVAHKVNVLVEAGLLERAGRRSGVYCGDRDFDESELMMLIYSVKANPAILQRQAEDLIRRIAGLGGEIFATGFLGNVEQDKDSTLEKNPEVFLNLELINEAIAKGKKISYDIYAYGADQKLHREDNITASPYKVFTHDHGLWLMEVQDNKKYEELFGKPNRDVSYVRIDSIRNVRILRKKAMDPQSVRRRGTGETLRADVPFDQNRKVLLSVDADIVDELMETFGGKTICRPDPENNGKILAEVWADVFKVFSFVICQDERVEIAGPPQVQKFFADWLKNVLEQYGN